MHLTDSSLFRKQCYINGKWLSANDGKTLAIYNPSQGTLVGTVPEMGAEETKSAIDAAQKALSAWKEKTAQERALLLQKWHALILEHIDDLAAIMTTEQGKPLAEAKGEIRYAMIARKAAPALAAGCTIIIKPAEATPFSALALAELSLRAGIPSGVLNILTGKPALIGGEMTSHPAVRKITFTGSTQVGKLLMAQSAQTVKKISLELGGSAPFIVFCDSDIDATIRGLIAAKFRNMGQACISPDRIFIEEKIYDLFVKSLIKAVQALKIGDGFDPGVQQGPLINLGAVEKIERHIQDAISKGAKLACGGKRHPLGKTFFEPTVLCEVNASMQIMQEETFGPVAPLVRFQTEEEVIQMANDTQYGLASYLYTRDIDRIWRFAEQLDFGMVCLNGGLFSNAVTPFGGMKESGMGREGSKYGIEEYLEIKYLCMNDSSNIPKRFEESGI